MDAKPAIHMAHLARGAARHVANVPETFPTRTRSSNIHLEPGVEAFYFVDGSPALALDTLAGRRILIWDPPDFSQEEGNPLQNLWGGSPAAPAIAAGALNSLTSAAETLHAAAIDMNQTMNICAWNSGEGGVRLMAANLEERLRNSADMSRHAILVVPSSWKLTTLRDRWSSRECAVQNNKIGIDLNQADSILLTAPQNR